MTCAGKSLTTIACILISVLAPSRKASAQQIPFYNSGELIKQGMEEYENGNYKKAREYYEKVPEGDTNYLLSLYERSLAHLQDSGYDKSIALSEKALKGGYTDRRQLLLNIGTAYDELGKHAEALRFYDSVARLYPHDNRPYYEKAVIEFKQEKYPAAERLLQQSLLLNPYHFRSHYLLGNIYAMEGRLTEAFIALHVSLVCTNDRGMAQGPIGMLSSLAQQTEDVSNFYSSKKPEYSHPLFDEIDEIVHAKLALDKGYALKTPIDDNIIRQLQVIMEKLSYDSKDSNFVMQYYVPLMKDIYDKDQFDPYVLLLFSEYGITSIDKMAAARKGKAKLEDIRKIVFPYLNNILGTRVLDYNKRKATPEQYTYYASDKMLVAGRYADRETKKFAEGFVQFYEEQSLVAEGHYNAAGKKTGTWNYYYASGIPRLKEQYKDGNLTGEAMAWFDNGMMSRKAIIDDNGIIKERTNYEYDGALESKSVWKGKDEYEVTYYNPDGSVMRVLTLVNEKPKDGSYTILYPGGAVKKEMSFKGGKLDGLFKSYFDNGVLMEAYTYKEGKIDGIYESFYRNGKPEHKFQYVAGKKDGPQEEHYEDGTLSLTRTFHNGKPDGINTYYGKKGTVYGTVTFRDNVPVALKFTSPDGKTLREAENRKGVNPLEYYNEYGVKKTSMQLDDKGLVQGKASYYNTSGVLSNEIDYKDDEEEGVSVNYYKNGKVNSKRHYKAGKTDGYYEAYFSGGQLRTEGWQKNGNAEGTWHNYWTNGNLQRDFFMVNDELNGPEKNYELNGKLDYITYYDHGRITGLTQYDSTGKVLQETTFDKGNGQYRMLYLNGNPGLECPLLHGKLHGDYTIHSPDKKLLEKGSYVQGKREGEFVTYYPNGKLRLKGTYKNGEKNGSWISYTTDGALEDESHYLDGMSEGVDKFYVNGILRYETNYHEDNKDGTVTIYGEDNKRAGVLYYDNGTLTGYSYEGADGQLLPVTTVTKGTASVRTFYAGGAKAIEFNFVTNCYEGLQKLYFSNGKLAEERMFAGDDYNGVYTRYNPDGSKAVEEQYSKDIQQGIQNRYDKNGKLTFTGVFLDGSPHGPVKMIDGSGKGMINLFYNYGGLQ